MMEPTLLPHWQTQIKAYRESGLTLQVWCDQGGIATEQMKYWMWMYSGFGSVSFGLASQRDLTLVRCGRLWGRCIPMVNFPSTLPVYLSWSNRILGKLKSWPTCSGS